MPERTDAVVLDAGALLAYAGLVVAAGELIGEAADRDLDQAGADTPAVWVPATSLMAAFGHLVDDEDSQRRLIRLIDERYVEVAPLTRTIALMGGLLAGDAKVPIDVTHAALLAAEEGCYVATTDADAMGRALPVSDKILNLAERWN